MWTRGIDYNCYYARKTGDINARKFFVLLNYLWFTFSVELRYIYSYTQHRFRFLFIYCIIYCSWFGDFLVYLEFFLSYLYHLTDHITSISIRNFSAFAIEINIELSHSRKKIGESHSRYIIRSILVLVLSRYGLRDW